jgi:uncharacterized protein YhjY with autotransporter beta-barrel domain
MVHLRRTAQSALRSFALAFALASPSAFADTVVIDTDRTGPVTVIGKDLIDVLPGVDISGALAGIEAANDARVRNRGSIVGTNFGIVAGRDVRLENRGLVMGGDSGVFAGRNAWVQNFGGKISGGTFGIFAEDITLVNYGDVWGGQFGVFGNGGAIRVFNHGDIEGGQYGIVSEGGPLRAWNWGRISGGQFGIYALDANLALQNYGLVEGGQFGVTVEDGDLSVANFGQIRGGQFGLAAIGGALSLRNWGVVSGGQFGAYSEGRASIYNWGTIRGGRFGVLVEDDLFLRNGGQVRGGEFGVLAQGRQTWIENFGVISGGDFGVLSQGKTRIVNHGTIASDRAGGFGIAIDALPGDHSLVNFGVVRGRQGSVYFSGPGTLTLGGTGYYIGDLVGAAPDETLRLNLVGVPVEVKQDLLRLRGPLDGPIYIPVFNIRARDFEFLEIQRLISFKEEAGGDFGSVGRSLDWRDITRDGSKSAFVEGFGELVGDPAAFRDALENVSGRSISHTLSDMAFANSYFWNQDLAHYFDLKRNKSAADAKAGLETTPWGGFAKATGIFADQDRTSHRQDGDWTVSGAYLGGDYTCDDDVTLGGFGGYTRSEADVDDFGSTLSSDDVHGGLYAGSRLGKLSIDGAAWYSHHDYDSKRVFESPTFSQQAQTRFDADQVSTYIRASYNWRPGLDERLEISPRLGLGYSHLWVDGWKEDSAPSRLGLETEDQEADSLRSALGARVSSRLDFGKLTLQPELRVDWMHEYLDDGRSIQGRWTSSAFQPFETESEVDDRDSAILGVGLTLNVPVCDCMKKLEFYAGYDAQLGRDEFRGQVANFQINYQF